MCALERNERVTPGQRADNRAKSGCSGLNVKQVCSRKALSYTAHGVAILAAHPRRFQYAHSAAQRTRQKQNTAPMLAGLSFRNRDMVRGSAAASAGNRGQKQQATNGEREKVSLPLSLPKKAKRTSQEPRPEVHRSPVELRAHSSHVATEAAPRPCWAQTWLGFLSSVISNIEFMLHRCFTLRPRKACQT
jgi:hypothetical protein